MKCSYSKKNKKYYNNTLLFSFLFDVKGSEEVLIYQYKVKLCCRDDRSPREHRVREDVPRIKMRSLKVISQITDCLEVEEVNGTRKGITK